MTWHDALDVVSAAATVGAAVLALIAIRISTRQARETAESIATERRRDLDLGVLSLIIEGLLTAPHESERAWERLRLLASDELPMTRWLYVMPDVERPTVGLLAGPSDHEKAETLRQEQAVKAGLDPPQPIRTHRMAQRWAEVLGVTYAQDEARAAIARRVDARD